MGTLLPVRNNTAHELQNDWHGDRPGCPPFSRDESAQNAAASMRPDDHAAWRCARSKKERGITLIEMLVVVTIIALFAALVAPRMFGQADKAKRTAARAQINSFMTALGSYKLDTGTFPTTEQGLQALRVKPEDMTQRAGPYLPQRP